MPIYDYKCKKCGEGFEELVKHSDPDPACPACGNDAERQISNANFVLKGTGWYKTDFKTPKEGK